MLGPNAARRLETPGASAMIRRDGHLRRDRPRRDEDPDGRRRRRSRGARLGAARRRRRAGGPPDVAAEMEAALRDAAEQAGVEPTALAGVGVGSPGTIDGGNVTSARNLPGLGRQLPARRDAVGRARDCRSGSATTCRSRPTPSSRSAPGRPYDSLLGVFWGTGVGGGIVLDGKPWIGRGARRRDRPHRRRARRRALHVRAARLHGGLRRARGDGSARARSSSRRARRPTCSS